MKQNRIETVKYITKNAAELFNITRQWNSSRAFEDFPTRNKQFLKRHRNYRNRRPFDLSTFPLLKIPSHVLNLIHMPNSITTSIDRSRFHPRENSRKPPSHKKKINTVQPKIKNPDTKNIEGCRNTIWFGLYKAEESKIEEKWKWGLLKNEKSETNK